MRLELLQGQVVHAVLALVGVISAPNIRTFVQRVDVDDLGADLLSLLLGGELRSLHPGTPRLLRSLDRGRPLQGRGMRALRRILRRIASTRSQELVQGRRQSLVPRGETGQRNALLLPRPSIETLATPFEIVHHDRIPPRRPLGRRRPLARRRPLLERVTPVVKIRLVLHPRLRRRHRRRRLDRHVQRHSLGLLERAPEHVGSVPRDGVELIVGELDVLLELDVRWVESGPVLGVPPRPHIQLTVRAHRDRERPVRMPQELRDALGLGTALEDAHELAGFPPPRVQLVRRSARRRQHVLAVVAEARGAPLRPAHVIVQRRRRCEDPRRVIVHVQHLVADVVAGDLLRRGHREKARAVAA